MLRRLVVAGAWRFSKYLHSGKIAPARVDILPGWSAMLVRG